MRSLFMSALILACLATATMGAVGETWILPIHHRDGGGWTEVPGAGYGGASAWQGSGIDGVRRVYWELSGIGSMGNPVPSTTELYTIEAFTPTSWPGKMDWQPIESQIKGVDGEAYPMESLIPWAGMWGTNHQYVGSNAGAAGTWVSAGPGPHSPESADYNAGASGIYMWLGGHGSPSWLYAKWDFGWPIERTWSALRVTQITPEPASALLLMLAAPMLLGRKRNPL